MKLINEAKAGFCSPAGDAKELMNVIIKTKEMPKEKLLEFGQNAGIYYKSNFEKNKLINQINDIIVEELSVINN